MTSKKAFITYAILIIIFLIGGIAFYITFDKTSNILFYYLAFVSFGGLLGCALGTYKTFKEINNTKGESNEDNDSEDKQ